MKLQPNDYSCIGTIAKHCDNSKLCIAENEASNFDLAELFCDFWFDIQNIEIEIKAYDALPDPKPERPTNYLEKKALLEGGTYIDCKGNQRPFSGIYTLLAYYSYSRYIIINRFSDTANGMVAKNNEFSIPTPLKELQDFSDKYRNMGLVYFNIIVKFICQNSSIFNYENCPKNNCGCNSGSCGSTKSNTKGYGFSSSNVSI
jgi:hypothetical protein